MYRVEGAAHTLGTAALPTLTVPRVRFTNNIFVRGKKKGKKNRKKKKAYCKNVCPRCITIVRILLLLLFYNILSARIIQRKWIKKKKKIYTRLKILILRIGF